MQQEQEQQQHHHQEDQKQAEKLDVIAIATRADQLTPEEGIEVEKAIRRGIKSFSRRLNLSIVRVVDARKSNSSSMNDLRREFMHLINRVLAVRFLISHFFINFLCPECCSSSWSSSPSPAPPPPTFHISRSSSGFCKSINCKVRWVENLELPNGK